MARSRPVARKGNDMTLSAEQGTTTIDSLVAQIKALEAKMASPARRVRGNVPKRSRQSSGSSSDVYGKAPCGVDAMATDGARKKAIETELGPNAIARWREGQKTGLLTVSSQGKVKNALDKDLRRCTAAGVGVWTFVYLPGSEPEKGVKPTADAALNKACEEQVGVPAEEVFKRMRSLGYAYHSNGHCFMCRCDGTPARGRRNYRNAAQYARPDDKE